MLMERSREARRSNMAAANGLSRRRQRNASLRDSHVEEDGQMELQDTVRLRDRPNKRERDRDRDRYRDREFSSHKIQNKRRRGDSLTIGNNKEEGDEESTEESVADEEDYEIDERRGAHTISHNTSSFSSSLSNPNSKKSLPPTRPARQALALKATDEIIGVLVPRKARSASVKRSHENWFSGNGGFWEDHKASTSPASRSAEANSPSSSNVSVRKKMKPGPKTRLPKGAKSSSSSGQQDDIEIEIAEVLYGLMKQSHNLKKEEDNIGKLEPKESKDISESQDTKPSISVLPQNNSPVSDLLTDVAVSKKKNLLAENSLNPVQNVVDTSTVKVEREINEKMEIFASKPERTSQFNVESSGTSHEMEVDTAKVASVTVDTLEEINKQGDSKSSIGRSGILDGPVTEKKSSSAKEESATCLKMDVDFQDSRVTKATSDVLENESPKEEKFKFDLMAPPPMVSSPERDGFNEFASDPSLEADDVKMESLVKDEVKVERFVKKESLVEETEEKKIEPIGEKLQLKIDLEKPNQDNGRDSFLKLRQQNGKQQQLQPKSSLPKVEKTEAGSVPWQIAVAGWPNGLPPLGYVAPFQTIMPSDGCARPSTAHQSLPFVFSQPRPKRCSTHCYIACNIYMNQQLAKMNPFWPAAAGSASLCRAKPNNQNVMPSTENLIHGNPMQGSFPVLNLNSGQDKGQAVVNFQRPSQKDKSSESVNLMDPAQKKQLVLQQTPQPAPAGNLLHAPAFIFPISQQQAAVTSAANQPGPSKSAATSTKSASSTGNSTAALPASSTALPAVAAAVGYNYPNLAANEAPYLTILQNNGYPFPIPAPVGTAPAIRGGTHAQPLPFFNGSFYSSQIFHPSQLQHQQQPHSQPLMQVSRQNTSTSSASSSSHKQLHSQLPRAVPVSGNNFMSSVSMQSQHLQKQHVSSSNQNRKLEAEMSGENTSPVAASRPHSQASVYGQNFSVPLQPLNFALMPSPTAGGNHSEKQQQSQQKSLKGGVDLIPQAFAMSFASFNGSNSASNLNFSSMPLNPAIFQSFPETARHGYQIVPAAQAALQKNHQISEVKTAGSLSNQDEGKKPGVGKSPATNVQTLVFDDSARTLNFASSPVTGNWPSRSIPATAITTNAPVAANSQSFQQQQLIQLQKQQMLQQQQQSTAAARVQSNSSSQSPQWKNSTRNATGQAPPTSSSTSTLKNVSQQQVRSPQSHTQISFERHSKSGLGPQIPTSNQSSSALMVGSPPSGGNTRTSSTGSKAGSSIPTLQSQQTDNSSASTGQKSSPVCGRNVPSILSTCPSHLSELKY
ncbi:Time for coffee, putative isoform 1 [Melia azedarach]|uniref:Time for coffee, putative isoform 1 n=1 Tax=Melia azedarach TaxID=155640 RepID=A0ACC1YXZ8_MELAZ|nr:Time for coffee, putative isoform 1 [Melia azedarach]